MQALGIIIGVVSVVAAVVFKYKFHWQRYSRIAAGVAIWAGVALVFDLIVNEPWDWWVWILVVIGGLLAWAGLIIDFVTESDPEEEAEDDADDTEGTPVVSGADMLARAGVILLAVVALIGSVTMVRLEDRVSDLEAWASDTHAWLKDNVVTHDDLDAKLDEITSEFATIDDVDKVKDTLETLTEDLQQNISDQITAEVGAQLAAYGGVRPVDNPAVRRFNGGSEFGTPICVWLNPDGLTGSNLESHLTALSDEDVARCFEEMDSRLVQDQYLIADELTATGLDARPYDQVLADMQDPAKRMAAIQLLREARVDSAVACLNGKVETQWYNSAANQIRSGQKTARCERDIVTASIYEVNGQRVRIDRRVHCGVQRLTPTTPGSPEQPSTPTTTPGSTPTTAPPPTTTPTTVPYTCPAPYVTRPGVDKPKSRADCVKREQTDEEIEDRPGTPPVEQPPSNPDVNVGPTPNAPPEPPRSPPTTAPPNPDPDPSYEDDPPATGDPGPPDPNQF